MVTDVNGCKDSINHNVIIDTLPVMNVILDSVCINDTSTFINTSRAANGYSISSWKWTFGNGDSSTVMSPKYLYANHGKYGVTLEAVDSKGCFNSISDSNMVYPLPVPSFTAGYACAPAPSCTGSPVTLSSTSTIPALGGSITGFAWDVDNNGTVDYNINPAIHSYNNSGTYKIVFRAISQFGCSDTTSRTIDVTDAPVASFSVDSAVGCGPLSVIISDSSQGFISNYNWSLFTSASGINNPIFTSTIQNPNPLPNLLQGRIGDTTYYVQLIVSSCCGADTLLDSIIVKPLPIVDFRMSVNQGCTPLKVDIMTDSLVFGSTDSIIVIYGDGTRNDTIYPNPLSPIWRPVSHFFYYNGPSLDTTYHVMIIGINDCGRDTAIKSVKVEPNRVAAFFQSSGTRGCAPLAVTFTSFSTGATQISYDFDYDPTSAIPNTPIISPNQSYTHTFTQPGRFVVAHFATNGCSEDTAFQTIDVWPQPEAIISIQDSICNNETLSLVNNSTISGGTINGYKWGFGNNDTSSNRLPNYTYSSGGNYTISLIVTSNLGCTDTTSQSISVFGRPEANFTTQNACLNKQPIQFTNSSTPSNDPIIGINWNFDDNNSSNTWSPSHTYSNPGTYFTKLTLVSHNGCADSITKSVIIHPVPISDFISSYTNDDSCGTSAEVQFNNTSIGANSFRWYFDWTKNKQDTSNLNAPLKTYTAPALYNILLVAENAFGCLDTSQGQVGLYPNPSSNLTVNTTEGCLPIVLDYNDNSSYSWESQYGSSITHRLVEFDSVWYPIDQLANLLNKSGVFSIRYLTQTSFGCADTQTLKNTITVYPLLEASFFPEEVRNIEYQFENTSIISTGTPIYQWDFGDSTTSNETSPFHKFQATPYYKSLKFNVCLKIDDSNGCNSDYCEPIELEQWSLFVPNAMTPERGEGEERYFLPKGLNLQTYHLQIFDTWGNKLWESTAIDPTDGSPGEHWDGMYMGELVPQGTYIWRIDATFEGGYLWQGKEYPEEGKKRVGTISVIR